MPGELPPLYSPQMAASWHLPRKTGSYESGKQKPATSSSKAASFHIPYRQSSSFLIDEAWFPHPTAPFPSGTFTPEWTLQAKLIVSDSTRPWSNRTITKLAISPDDKLIVTTAETTVSTRFLKVWDIETRSIKTKFHDPTGSNSSSVFSPDNQRLAAICNEEKDLYIWDLETGKLTVKVDNGNFWANAPVFSPTGDLVASASNHGCLYIWRLGV
ncbi:Quino protein amine dehydrogenase [Aspergillus venezuelensis]